MGLDVLLIVQNTAGLDNNESAIKSDLETAGHTVTTRNDSDAELTSGYDIVVACPWIQDWACPDYANDSQMPFAAMRGWAYAQGLSSSGFTSNSFQAGLRYASGADVAWSGKSTGTDYDISSETEDSNTVIFHGGSATVGGALVGARQSGQTSNYVTVATFDYGENAAISGSFDDCRMGIIAGFSYNPSHDTSWYLADDPNDAKAWYLEIIDWVADAVIDATATPSAVATSMTVPAPTVTRGDVTVLVGRFDDDFNRANSTTTLGDPWQAHPNCVWGINSNGAYLVSQTATSAVDPADRNNSALVDIGSPSHTVEMTVGAVTDGGEHGQHGVIVRYVDSENWVRVQTARGYATWNVYECVNGTVSYLGNAGLAGTGEGVTLKVTVSGTSLSWWINDNAKTGKTLTGTTGNGVGLYADYNAVGTNYLIDDWAGYATSPRGPQATAATVPAPTIVDNSTATPAAVATAAAVPVPTETTAATPEPAAVATSMAVGAATLTAAATPEPSTVATVAATPTPTVVADSTATPAVVAMAVAVNAPASVTTAATPTPAVVATSVTVPAPTYVEVEVAEPATVATAVAVPAPTIVDDSTATPSTVATAVAVPAPTETTAATPTPAAVATAVTVPAPTLDAEATPEPDTVAAVATVPDPVLKIEVPYIEPNPVVTAVAVPAPTVTPAATGEPAVVATSVTVGAATLDAAAAPTPDPVATPAVVEAPTVTTAATAEPDTVATSATVPTPGIGAAAQPATVATAVVINAPGVSTSFDAPTVATSVAVPNPDSEPLATVTPSTVETTMAVTGGIKTSDIVLVATVETSATVHDIAALSASLDAPTVETAATIPAPTIDAEMYVPAPSPPASTMTVGEPGISAAHETATVETAAVVEEPNVALTVHPTAVATSVGVPAPAMSISTPVAFPGMTVETTFTVGEPDIVAELIVWPVDTPATIPTPGVHSTDALRDAWRIRILDRAGAFITELPTWRALTGGVVLDDVGACSFTVDRDDPTFVTHRSTLMDSAPIVELWWADEAVARYVIADYDDVIVDADEAPAVQFVCVGLADDLDHAIVLPDNYPTSTVPDRGWSDVAAAAIIAELIDEAQARGAGTLVSAGFDGTDDSDGTPWGDTTTHGEKCGASVLAVMRKLATRIGAHWAVDATGTLEMRQAWGDDVSDTVRFFAGVDQLVLDEKQTARSIVNAAYGFGFGAAIDAEEHGASIDSWGRRESWISVESAQSQALAAITQAAVDYQHDPVQSVTLRVDPTRMGRRVWTDFGLGDIVGYDDWLNGSTSARVHAISWAVDESGATAFELTLKSRTETQQQRFADLLNNIKNPDGTQVVGDGGTSTHDKLVVEAAGTIPTQVTGLAGQAGLRTLTVSWNAVSDTDFRAGTGKYQVQVDSISAQFGDSVWEDSFDRANNPSTLGAGWTAQVGAGGAWGIISNAAYLSASGGLNNAATHDIGSANHYVEATVGAVAGTASNGVVVRWQDSNNYVYVASARSFATWNVYEVIGGTIYGLGNLGGYLPTGEGTVLRVEVDGTNLVGYCDDVECPNQKTLSGPDGTALGLYSSSGAVGSGYTIAHFDSGVFDSIVHDALTAALVNSATGLLPNHQYWVRVRAVDAALNVGPWSDWVTATTVQATGSDVADAAIDTQHIANAAITSAKIGTAQIGAAQIADGSITNAEIANATIQGAKIANATITGDLVANGTITGSKVAASTITASNLAVGTITADRIQAGTITADRISSNTITGGNLAYNTVTYDRIAPSTIRGSNIYAGTIAGSHIGSATIVGGNIAGSTITGGNIAGGTITGSNIANGTITGSKIQGGTITGSLIAGSAITGSLIANSAIVGAHIQNSVITNSHISTVSADKVYGGTIAASNIYGVNISGCTITGSSITATGTLTGAYYSGGGVSIPANLQRIDIGSHMLYNGGATHSGTVIYAGGGGYHDVTMTGGGGYLRAGYGNCITWSSGQNTIYGGAGGQRIATTSGGSFFATEASSDTAAFVMGGYGIIKYRAGAFSSRRWKQDIRPMGGSLAMLRALRPITYRYDKRTADWIDSGNNDLLDWAHRPGFVLEDVLDAGLDEFVDYMLVDDDGRPTPYPNGDLTPPDPERGMGLASEWVEQVQPVGVNGTAMIPRIVAAIQELADRVDALTGAGE